MNVAAIYSSIGYKYVIMVIPGTCMTITIPCEAVVKGVNVQNLKDLKALLKVNS